MADRTDKFSIPAEGYEPRAGETVPRVHPQLGVYAQPYDDKVLSNTYDVLVNGLEMSKNGDFIGWREDPKANKDFTYHTYEKVKEMAVTLGTALVDSGLKKGDRVGLFAANCPNVTIVDLACSTQGLVVVPLYDTLAPNAIEYILNHAGITTVFVQDEKSEKIREVRPKCKSLKQVVVIGKLGLRSIGKYQQDDGVISMSEFYDKGTFDESKMNPGELTDLAMIMYTSGTTGNPKGVMLKNQAFIAGIAVGCRFLGQTVTAINPSDRMLSYLPLAHIFGQCAEKLFMLQGGKIGYWQGDIRLILEDLLALRPTVFFGVPRVFARFEQRIRDTLESSSFLKKILFDYAYNAQLNNLKKLHTRNAFFDKLVFSKVKAKLLPDVRFCVTGAAPMSPDTNDFLKVVLCAPARCPEGLDGEGECGILAFATP